MTLLIKAQTIDFTLNCFFLLSVTTVQVFIDTTTNVLWNLFNLNVHTHNSAVVLISEADLFLFTQWKKTFTIHPFTSNLADRHELYKSLKNIV